MVVMLDTISLVPRREPGDEARIQWHNILCNKTMTWSYSCNKSESNTLGSSGMCFLRQASNFFLLLSTAAFCIASNDVLSNLNLDSISSRMSTLSLGRTSNATWTSSFLTVKPSSNILSKSGMCLMRFFSSAES